MTLETEKIVGLDEPFWPSHLPREKRSNRIISRIILRTIELPDLPFLVIFRPTLNSQRWWMILEIDKLSSLLRSAGEIDRVKELGLAVSKEGAIHTSRPKIPDTGNLLTFDTYTKEGGPASSKHRLVINLCTHDAEAVFKKLSPLRSDNIY